MVIQRWQSVLLLIASVMTGLFSFCALGLIQSGTDTLNLYSYGIYNAASGAQASGTIYVTVVAMLAALLLLINIFLYKNTRLQKRVCLISLVLIVAALASCWLGIDSMGFAAGTKIDYSLTGIITPAVALLSILAARHCIRSDEKKLAAADRLR